MVYLLWFTKYKCAHVRAYTVQLVEAKLAAFVEEIVAPPGLVNVIIDGEVNT